jgi:predicted AAA+ superfamily ATPase|tara:strand:+ start:5290 stop:6744 length:1455 start_codon:yes stop_codon:yes gene_type:complete
MLLVSENEVQKRLFLDNPWWEQNKIDARFEELPRRAYFEHFYELVSDRDLNRAVILMGPRRVGKTVMVHHSIQGLIETKVSSDNILYLSLETPVYTGLSLEQVLNKFIELKGHKRDSEIYIYFDEVQYLKDWEVHLKSLVDTYPSYKFIATGSAAAALRLKSRESGAGRFTEFLLPPLTFAEFLDFIGKTSDVIGFGSGESEGYKVKDINELNSEFVNYLNYGGYPEAVFSRKIQEDSSRYIKSDIIDKVLLRDLPSLYGISDIQELNRLFTTIAYNSGNEVSYEALSKNSGVAKNTLKKYLEYLEAAFLIKIVKRVDENAKHFKRVTTFKVYLTNPSMRAALFGAVDINDNAMGNLTETAIFSQWLHSDYINHLYYARWSKAEVDIVGLSANEQEPHWAVEVKWTDAPINSHNKIAGLIEFASKNKLEEVALTSKTVRTTIDKGKFTIDVIPSALQTFVLGKNILKNKTKEAWLYNKQIQPIQ